MVVRNAASAPSMSLRSTLLGGLVVVRAGHIFGTEVVQVRGHHRCRQPLAVRGVGGPFRHPLFGTVSRGQATVFLITCQ
jgi:predicted metal-binding membrane protein